MTCHCFIRHAITGDEISAAAHRLEEARRGDDTNGILIAIAALTGKCPARPNFSPGDRKSMYGEGELGPAIDEVGPIEVAPLKRSTPWQR